LPVGVPMAVAEGCAGGVVPVGWDDVGVSVGAHEHLPVAGVEEPVMMPAEQTAVGQVGGPAAAPGFDVM
jgi:hypothetical protein